MTRPAGLDTVYVVGLRTSDDRRRSVSTQLARFDIVPEFIDEWDAVDITPEIEAKMFTGDLNHAQKSCSLKHTTALRRIVERSERHALVLEDDALLSPGFAEGVQAALAEWNSHPQPSVVFIGCGGNWYTPHSRRRPGQRLYPNTRGRLADSYLIGVDAAKARLDWMARHRMSHPIDNQYQIIDDDMHILLLWLEEPVVEQGSKTGLFDTTLEPDSQWPQWLQALVFRWEKLRRKYLYQLWR